MPGLREIIIIGSFQPADEIARFVQQMQQEFHISIRFEGEVTGFVLVGDKCILLLVMEKNFCMIDHLITS